ncbi:MAG TPA: NAD(+)/NADH kinase [Candidatus Avidesulfovibrio excrementigallinarum]|nr:NAD(+)/NADH kinase [Candidatus Avidesulfovibrio excrementigallinarum]
MRTPIRLLLVAKSGHAQAHETAEAMRRRMERRGLDVCLADSGESEALDSFFARGCERAAVVVLGGDGTLVGVARRLLTLLSPETICPLLGVNFGKVGFLTEVPAESWESAADALVEGRLPLASRLALRWKILRPGDSASPASGFAVNDVVVSRCALARVLTMHIAIDGHPLGALRADGMLVSTPAGTSGYALSAGASLIHPEVEALSLAAISPFLSRFPSMVLPAASQVDIQVDETTPESFLTVDGQDGFPMKPGDTLRVQGQSKALWLAVPAPQAYYSRLGRCGFVLPTQQ